MVAKNSDKLVMAYQSWVEAIEAHDAQTPPVPADLEESARILALRCRVCLERIDDGLGFLRGDSRTARIARDAFRLANHAMLIAQLRASRDVRTPRLQDDRLVWDKPIAQIDAARPHPHRGYWRAFQIAFLLMSLRGICDLHHPDRTRVDLIWFPTGRWQDGGIPWAHCIHYLLQSSGGARNIRCRCSDAVYLALADGTAVSASWFAVLCDGTLAATAREHRKTRQTTIWARYVGWRCCNAQYTQCRT